VLSLLRSRQLDVALLRGEDAYLGLRGAGPYALLATPLCALAGVAPEHLYVLASPQSAIRTIPDLRNRRVGADDGGRARLKLRRLVAVAGLDPDTDVRWSPLRTIEAAAALERGEVDVWCLESPSLASAHIQLGREHRLRAVDQADAVRAVIDRHGPVYFAAAPDEGLDAGFAGNGPVLGEVRLLVCRDNYPTERARILAEALEGWDSLAPPQTPLPIPLHPAVATLKRG
jgi:TRAP-type uncharacterized transport system substrate-binding protein